MAPTLDDQALDKLRHVGDADADAVAADLRDRHPQLDEPDLVRLVLRDLALGTDAADDGVRAWMAHGPDLPDWADPETIRAGQRFFGDWPLAITTALFCVSLPSAYAAASGAHVLGMTSDLATKNATRRIAETGQMFIDVMDLGRERPEVLRPGGVGYATIRGVRLLHAVVRRTLLSGTTVPQTCDESVVPRWCADWGVPVNQEDLLGTLFTFTTAVFHGLDRLGVPYDPTGADAYLHTWCVIGHLLGIRPELLPVDRAQALALAHTIERRHHRCSPTGDRLLANLLRQMELAMPWGLRHLPRTLLHHMLPPEVAAVFPHLPPPAPWGHVLALGARTGPVLARVPGGRRLVQGPTEVVGRSMIRMYVDRALHGEGPPFRVDERATAHLALGTSPVRRTMRTRRRRIRTRHQARRSTGRPGTGPGSTPGSRPGAADRTGGGTGHEEGPPAR